MEQTRKILDQLAQGQLTPEAAQEQIAALREPASSHHRCCAESPYKFTEEHNFDAPAQGLTLDLAANNGSITVKTWSGDKVRLELTKKVRAASSQEAEALAASVQPVMQDNCLRIKDSNDRVSISLNLQVPQGLTCSGKLKTCNGSIQLTDLKGKTLEIGTNNGSVRLDQADANQLMVKSNNGSLDIEGAITELEARTTNGSITMNNKAVICTANLATINGRIRATIPGGDDRALRLKATTACGRINLDGIKGTITKHTITGRKAEIDTGNWNTATIKAELDISTANGSIEISH